MKALVYGSPAGSALYAAKKIGLDVECLQYKAGTIEDMCFGGWMGFPTYTEGHVDILITSGQANLVKPLLKSSTPELVLWDLGPRPVTKKVANAAIVPLQLLGYDVVVLTKLSSHTLGYNYAEDRGIVIAKKSEQVNILPSKLRISRPFTPLSSIVRTDGDEDIIPVFSGKVLFHKETRPWTFVSVPKANTYLLSHPLSIKCGAVWYNINGKLHRLTVSEAAAIVGYPLEAQAKLTTLCDDRSMLVYNILRDLSYPMWVDLFERLSLCE